MLSSLTHSKRHRGLVEIFSSIVVRSGYPGELRAFVDSIGQPLSGSSTGRPTHRGETNMRTSYQFVDENVEAAGLEWVIPPVVDRSFLDASASENYHVRMLDVIEFARCALIRVYMGGEKPYAEWSAIHKPITWGVEGARQQIRFRDVLLIDRVEKFWVSVEFPGASPRFGLIPRRDGTYQEGLAAALPVTFRFLEEASLPPALAIQPVAEVLARAEALQKRNEELYAKFETLIRPTREADAKVAAEMAELRKCFGSDEEMLDVLRAVRQGVRTR